MTLKTSNTLVLLKNTLNRKLEYNRPNATLGRINLRVLS